MKIDTDLKKIEQILTRGTVDIISEEDLRKKLLSGKELNIKFGIDPTGPDLHIGRAATIGKIQDFLELGHRATVIIGDGTGVIGDASDKAEQRKSLPREEIEENMKTYKDQIGKIIDLSKVTFRYNSEWLNKLNFLDILHLAKEFTVAQMIERDNYFERWTNHKPIGLHEFIYPLMQGYDSVAIEADVEIGGTDQLFNLLAGRRIQELFKLPQQNIITTELLPGLDGRKMSTSWGNIIKVTENANDMYGKVMSIRDDLIIPYFEIVTRVEKEKINEYKDQLHQGINPMNIKKELAYEITKKYHGEDAAITAANQFKHITQEKKIDENNILEIKEGSYSLLDILTLQTGMITSRTEAKRLIDQNAVEVNGEKKNNPKEIIHVKKKDSQRLSIKAGKRNSFFLKVV